MTTLAWLGWLLACRSPSGGLTTAPDTEDSASSTTQSTSVVTLTSHTAGTSATGAPTGESGSVPTNDTGTATVVFDTAGPACAGGGGDTGLIEVATPSQEPCTFVLPPSGAPGPVVRADDIVLATITGANGSGLGFALAALGDTDGDGLGELAIGRPGDFGGPGRYGKETQGEVWVFAGGALRGDLRRPDATAILEGRVVNNQEASGQGWYLTAGDLTGDGLRDLVIGGRSYHPTMVVPLPVPAGVHIMEDLVVASIDPPGGATLWNPAVGDVTGDGIPDLSLSGDATFGLTGGVTVFEGPLSTIAQDPEDRWATYLMDERDDPYEVSQGQASGRYMMGVMFDVDGDGASEVVVGGDKLANIQPSDGAATVQGGIGLFRGAERSMPFGGEPGTQRSQHLVALAYGECDARIGYETARVGDVSGDCRPDLAVGSSLFVLPGELPRGAVYVVSEWHRARGDVPIQAISSATIVGEAPGEEVWSAGYLGDLNQDGYDDLAVGAPAAFGEGRVYIFLGPVQGTHLASDADLVLAGSGGSFGYHLRGIFDVTGDGVVDLAVSAHSTNDSDGKVYVFSGADLLAQMP
mgnify:CR=1 FL=1